MKKTIKLGGSFEGVIATGPFQNARPGFYLEETIEFTPLGPEIPSDAEIIARVKHLQEKCYELFKEAERNAIKERIENERKDFRFRKLPSGKIVPSVTTILNFDKDFDMPPDELSQYAAWGTCAHGVINEYWKTLLKDKKGVWKKPQDIEGIYAEFVTVMRGSLLLNFEDLIDFPAYLLKYPFECKGYGIEVYNEEHEYAGELDYWGIPGPDKDWKSVYTLVDAKRTPTKEHFLQTAAYSKAKPYDSSLPWPERFEQMMLMPLRSETKQGFSKPTVNSEIDRAFELFLNKRKKCRQRYGV